MHFSRFLIGSVISAVLASCVDLSEYEPQTGVDSDFTAFYTELVDAADNATATTDYTDFFAVDGYQQTLSLVAVGRDAILRQKQAFLPPAGDISKFVHFPNVTTVLSENSTARVYEAHGRIERTFVSAGNCSSVYYKTRYTLLKVDGAMDFTIRGGQVYAYTDYYVSPATSAVTDVPCK